MTQAWLPALRSTCHVPISKIAVLALFGALSLVPAAYAQHGGGSSGGGSGGGGGSHGGGGGGGFSGSSFGGSHSSGSSAGYGGSHSGSASHGGSSNTSSRANGAAHSSSASRSAAARNIAAPSHEHTFWHALAFWHHSAPAAQPVAPMVVSALPTWQLVSHVAENHDWSALLPTRPTEPQARIETRQGLALFSKLEARHFSPHPDQARQNRRRPPICGYRHELCRGSFYYPYNYFFPGYFECDHSLETLFPIIPLPEPYPGAPYHIEHAPCQRPVLRYDIPPSKNKISAKTGATVEPGPSDFNLFRVGW